MGTFKLFLVTFLVFSSGIYNIFSQDVPSSIAPLYTGPGWGNISDTGITCSGGPLPSIIRDDGTYENGYRSASTGDSTTFVQKMVMPSTPFNIQQMCVTWTALAPSGSLTFDIMIYDTLGAGGSPGNLVYRTNNRAANNIAIYPLHTRYTYPIFYLTSQRAYYFGVRWNNNPVLPFFISSDENGPPSTMGPGYQRLTTTYPPVFTDITLAFPLFKSFGIRLEGAPAPSGGSAQTFCRGGLNLPINDFSTTVDSILTFPVLGDDCIVTDVNVRIDSVLHTWDSDLNFYLQRNNIGVKIIEHVGGSGDNFIGTILNDSAATPIASGTAPFTGSFRPSSPLAVFNGNPGPNGRYWKLRITDTAAGDTGILKRWCLVITATCPVGGIQTFEFPNYYFLGQNYPNPFNPVTKIKFGVPESGNVRLIIYDILGREVETVLNEFKNPGTFEVNFDASKLASGVYFYTLVTQRFTETKKMLIIK